MNIKLLLPGEKIQPQHIAHTDGMERLNSYLRWLKSVLKR